MVDAQSPMQPQDAFEELARITLEDHSLESVMDTIAGLTKRTLPGADEVSVTLIEKGNATTVAFTGPLALACDERQYAAGWGPCLDSIDGGQPVRIDSMRTEERWRDWALQALQNGAQSSLSIPVPLQREVSAALNVYSTSEYAFDDTGLELGATFAAYAGVALANMHLYEAQSKVVDQLQTAMQSRAVIEQAKGIVMAERRCTAEEAFNVLVRLSQESNRKLREVAQALVEEAGGWTARTGPLDTMAGPTD
jgi:GAF domain-containing protein